LERGSGTDDGKKWLFQKVIIRYSSRTLMNNQTLGLWTLDRLQHTHAGLHSAISLDVFNIYDTVPSLDNLTPPLADEHQ